MKKLILAVIAITLLLLTLSGCTTEKTYVNYVTELKCDIYEGSSENYTVKASYGFSTVKSEDSDKISKIYKLNFKLLEKESDQTTYTLTLKFDNLEYTKNFSYNPVNSALCAEIEIENFNEKTFSIDISVASNTESVTLNSIVPENAMDYKSALSRLQTDQPTLFEAFSTNGNFNGSISMRIIVKDNVPYWYVGLTDGERTKALLLNAVSGETLAIREVF